VQSAAGATGRQAVTELVPPQFTGDVQFQVAVPAAVIFEGSSVKLKAETVNVLHPSYCTGPMASKLISVSLIVPFAVAVLLNRGAVAVKELLPCASVITMVPVLPDGEQLP